MTAWLTFKVVGGEYLQDGIAYIVATSHISRLDTPFLMLSTHRQDIIAMVAREYEKAPFFGWFLNKLGVIWISRDGYDMSAFRRGFSLPETKLDRWISPGRDAVKNEAAVGGQAGAALLAIRNRVQVIPAAVLGSASLNESFRHLKKAEVEVRFGEPFLLDEAQDERTTKDRLKQATDEIMCRIALLLPEEHRGFYANHPRLKELLAQAEQNQAGPALDLLPKGD